MNEVLINALANRVKAGDMKLEQVPIPYREQVGTVLEAIAAQGESHPE